MGVQGSNKSSSFTSADRVLLAIGVLAFIAGGVVLLTVHGTGAVILAIGLIGLTGICLVSLLFLLVGESEDRHYQKGSP